MASSHKAGVLALLCAALGGCYANGNGDGSATGFVSAAQCDLDPAEPFSLDFDYFQVDPTEDFLEVLIQQGADGELRSDSILIFVSDPAEVKASGLGVPIAVDLAATDGVSMTLSLNNTCPFVRDDENTPVVYSAVSGTITFSSLYFPDVDDAKVTAAVFTDVRFEDPNHPDDRFAVLSGEFSYKFSRGAQRNSP